MDRSHRIHAWYIYSTYILGRIFMDKCRQIYAKHGSYGYTPNINEVIEQHSFQRDGEGISPRMLAMTIMVKETCPWTSQDTSYPPPPTKNFMTHHCTSTNGGSSIVNILQCSNTKGQLNLCRSYLTQLWVYICSIPTVGIQKFSTGFTIKPKCF